MTKPRETAAATTPVADRARLRLLSGRDYGPAVVAVLGAAVMLLQGFDGPLDRDRAIYAYAGQQVVAGQPPYEGILNRAGPLAHLLPAVGVALARGLGTSDVLGIRLVFFALSLAALCVAYLVGREYFGSRTSGYLSAVALLAFAGFVTYAVGGPREKTAMVLFLLAMLLSLRRRRYGAAGAWIALATLTWQPAFLVALPAAAVVALGERGRLRRLAVGRVALGGAVPTAVCVGYFVAVGAWWTFFEAFVLINARYTGAVPFWDHPAHNLDRLWAGYGPSLVVLVIGVGAALYLGVADLPARAGGDTRQGGGDPPALLLSGLAVATVCAVVVTVRQFDGWPDAFVLLPLAAVGFAGLAGRIARRIGGRPFLEAALAVLLTGFAATSSWTSRPDALTWQVASTRAVLDVVGPEATVASVGAPAPLVLGQRTNPTRHQMVVGPLGAYLEDTWPGGVEGFGRSVLRSRPEVLAVGLFELREALPGLHREYRRAGRSMGWQWWLHESLGSRRIAQAREAARAVSRDRSGRRAAGGARPRWASMRTIR